MFKLKDGDSEIEVQESVHFREYHEVDGDDHETDYIIATERGSSNYPEAVTQELAIYLRDEFDFDVEEHDIRVVVR